MKRIKFYPPHILEDRRKKNPKARNFYYEIEYHPATIHFWIDRFVPAARQGLDISVDSPEEFYRALEAARRLDPPKPPIEPRDSETKVELLHDKKTNQ